MARVCLLGGILARTQVRVDVRVSQIARACARACVFACLAGWWVRHVLSHGGSANGLGAATTVHLRVSGAARVTRAMQGRSRVCMRV